jgi:hypothetical protein
MPWFVRENKGIVTPTEFKRETPDGLWYQCPECKTVILTKAHRDNSYTCPSCNHHEQIGSAEYFDLLFDQNLFEELFMNLQSGDPLEFVDTKKYPDRLKASMAKTGMKDAMKDVKNELIVRYRRVSRGWTCRIAAEAKIDCSQRSAAHAVDFGARMCTEERFTEVLAAGVPSL